MPITINFPNILNVSVQVGDIAYFTSTSSVGGFDTSGTLEEIGKIIQVGEKSITCNVNVAPNGLDQGSYIMFAKDRRVNMSSLLGYFARIKLINDSTEKAEIYSIGVDVFESSK